MTELRSFLIGAERPILARELTLFGLSMSKPDRLIIERVIRTGDGASRVEPTNIRAEALPGSRSVRMLDVALLPACRLRVSVPAEERGMRVQRPGPGEGPVRFYADESGAEEVHVAFAARTEFL